ncbi:right-handed parallel beta-helix repeat-containing protein [uncultured Jatrophihabitans sp.]|uniref:right-handed parallel beta-helix repeat-containing protein n=1 Tax=uncultured Jatrophihabitans sp. TaxID=1610747 RepID=UPI0035CCA8F7
MNVARSASVTIQAYPGEAVWFDGSSAATQWTRAGGSWATPFHAHFDHSASFTSGSDAGGFVNPAFPMAAHPEQVFVDGVSQRQVADGATPLPGQFSVDPSAGRLLVGSNPADHAVRVSDLTQAFVVSGRVTLRGFGVRNYATSLPQIGTVYLGGHVGGDRLENLVITQNATQGLSVGASNTTVTHVTASDNGMTGIHSNHARNLVIQNSLITGNNREHFNDAPAAAGMKITNGDGIIVRNNVVSANVSVNGIWTDVSTRNFDIVGNTVRASGGRFGIITELSDSGIVAGNVVAGAQYGYTAFDTGHVKVFNNTFSDNRVWDVGLTQDARRNSDPVTRSAVPWLVRNIQVTNNVFGVNPMFQFYALDKATHRPASQMRIVVNGNFFRAGRAVMVGWGGGDNVTVTRFRTPQSLDSALRVSWRNVLQQTAPADARTTSMAVPLPADVAAAIGRTTGTRQFGAS